MSDSNSIKVKLKRVLKYCFAVLGCLTIAGVYVKTELPKYREAFLYAYGPYEFARSIQDLSLQRLGSKSAFHRGGVRPGQSPQKTIINKHIHNRSLTDHTQRTVTTPNNDTLYTSAVLELSSTPVEVIVPKSGNRYISIALMDAFTDQFAHIGPQELLKEENKYWILNSLDNTPIPDDVTPIRAPGNDVWLLARVFVSGENDLPLARSTQAAISVKPVFPERSIRQFANLVTEISDFENFLNVTNELVSRNQIHPQTQRLSGYRDLGLGSEKPLTSIQSFFWGLVLNRGEAALAREIDKRFEESKGWSTPPDNIGQFGQDDATRAAVALIGFGALRKEDAIYYRITKTVEGSILDGQKDYKIVMPKDMPASAFWSLSLYEIDESGRFFFYKNPTNRHSLNSHSLGLARGINGEISISITPINKAQSDTNWMPTPRGPFAAFLRLYVPDDSAVSGQWTPPPIIEQKPSMNF